MMGVMQRARLVRCEPPRRGVVASVARGRGSSRAVIALLDRWIPVLSLGVALPLRRAPGRGRLGARRTRSASSVASMLAFNFFFLEPVHTFTLADSRNWFALARLRRHRGRRLRARGAVAPAGARGGAARRDRDVAARARDRRRRARADLGRRGAGAAGRAGADRARRRTRTATSSTAGGRRVGTIRLEGGDGRCARAPAPAAGARLAARRRDRPRAARSARRSRPRRCAAPTR